MTLAKPDFSNLPKFEKNFYLVSYCWLHFVVCCYCFFIVLSGPACFFPCMNWAHLCCLDQLQQRPTGLASTYTTCC